MTNAGGQRPGAGRKKGSLGKKTIEEVLCRQFLIEHYLSKWQEIADTMLDLALGKVRTVKIKGKKTLIYKRIPDQKAIQNIIETVIGKPKERIDNIVNLPQLDQLTKSLRAIAEEK